MLTITRLGGVTTQLELTGILPETWAAESLTAVAKRPVLCGNRRDELGAHFAVSGSTDTPHLILLGDLAAVKGIGANMTAGVIEVHSAVGMHAGAGMAGGRLTVHGPAGAWAGAEMRDGTLEIVGDAGPQLAGAYPGSRHGMRGGTVVVRGDAGPEAAVKMRGGLVAVRGHAGPFAAWGMVAGTVVAKSFGPRAGAGLKRGTLVSETPPDRCPGWAPTNAYEGVYLELLRRHLESLGLTTAIQLAKPHRVYRGDALTGGRGEWFVAVEGS